MEKCRICENEVSFLFTATVLGKYQVNYFKCSNCQFIQTEYPYWLEEAYNNSINLGDTGLIRRNIIASKCVSTLLFFLFNVDAKYLDYAGGYGIFTRIMRDIGFDFTTYDPYTTNLLARGFDYNQKDKVELVTTFESFEHFADPLLEIQKILSISTNVFFSTQLIPKKVPALNEWWYYSPEHGQHISFYSATTLRFIAKKYDLNFYSLKGYHLFTKRKIGSIVFKLLVGFGHFGLHSIIRFFLKSKVMTDMCKLNKK